MKHLSDIEIAQKAELDHIVKIAKKLGVEEDDLDANWIYTSSSVVTLAMEVEVSTRSGISGLIR